MASPQGLRPGAGSGAQKRVRKPALKAALSFRAKPRKTRKQPPCSAPSERETDGSASRRTMCRGRVQRGRTLQRHTRSRSTNPTGRHSLEVPTEVTFRDRKEKGDGWGQGRGRECFAGTDSRLGRWKILETDGNVTRNMTYDNVDVLTSLNRALRNGQEGCLAGLLGGARDS